MTRPAICNDAIESLAKLDDASVRELNDLFDTFYENGGSQKTALAGAVNDMLKNLRAERGKTLAYLDGQLAVATPQQDQAGAAPAEGTGGARSTPAAAKFSKAEIEVGALPNASDAQILEFYAKDQEANLYPGAQLVDGVGGKRNPGTELAYWGTESAIGPHREIASYAEATDTGGFAVKFVSLRAGENVGSTRLEDATLIEVFFEPLPTGGYSVAVLGPEQGSALYRDLAAKGLARPAAPADADGAFYTRLDGVPSSDVFEVLTEARRRLTRHLGGAVPAISFDRATGWNVVRGERTVTPETLRRRFSVDRASGSTVASVQAEVAKLKLATNGRVQVVQSVSDLPTGVKATIEKESGTGGKVQAFVLNGKAYLIADNIAPGNARAVFMHEVGAHLGIDNLLTKAQYDNLIRKLLSWADKNDGSMESRLARRAVQRAGAAGTPDVDLHSEVLAYFVEEAVRAGIDPTALKYSSEIGRWFAELIQALKQALRKLQMFTAPDLTPQDVVNLAYGAAKLELEAPLSDAPGGALMESRIVRDEQGNREYEGDGVRIAFPQPTDRVEVIPTDGQRVMNYAIMPADSFGVLGHVDLLLDANGVPESLLDIEVYERGRGAGEKAVAALLNAYPNRSINISNIVPEAQGFWEKLGVPAQNLEEGAAYDGTLNAAKLQAAQRSRAESAARSNTRSGGTSNRGADTGAARGVRGEVQGVGRVQFSKFTDDIASIRDAMPVARRAQVAGMFGAFGRMAEGAKQLGLGALTNFQIAEQFADMVPALKTRTAHVVAMIQRRGQLSEMVTDVSKAWDKLADKTQLNALMRDATLAEVHPDVDANDKSNAHMSEAQKAKHADLHARYKLLSPEAKKVYQDAKKVLADQWTARSTAMVRMIENATADRGALAMQSGADEATLEKIRKEGAAQVAQYREQLGRVKGPYFPLLRFGNYLAVSESKELQAKAAALEGMEGDALKKAREEVQAMRKDEKHYSVSAHDTKADALAAVKLARARNMESRLSLTDPTAGRLSRESAGLMAQFKESLQKKWGQGDLDSDALNEAVAAMTQVYLANLPEMHALKRQAERKGIAGASVDMLRAFSSAGQQNAFMASRMEYADALATDLLDIKRQSKDAMADTDSATPGYVANEMLKRHALDMEYKETPVQDWLTTAGYTYYLGASPAFLIMNLLQPALVSVPVMAGRFGFARSSAALTKAYGDTLKLLKATRYTDEGKFDPWRTLDADDKRSLPNEGDRWALRQLIDRGAIDEGLSHELTTYAGDGSRALARVQRVVGWTGQQVEIANRVSTALATYRLALGPKPAKNPDGTWSAAHDAAVEQAYATTVKTQMDYSSEATARYMREGGGVPMAKLVFQFRRFQQGMLYLLLDNIKRALPEKAGGEGSAEARKTLAWLFATTGMAAGAIGLPFMGAILWAAGLGDDDDDPRGNPETRMKNLITDTFGPEMGAVLTRGLPAAFGVDISRRVGLGDVASPFPMARLDEAKNTREGAKELLFNAAGPGIGMTANVVEGMTHIMAGDFQKGAEKILPKMFADLSRGMRYATEGMTDSKGNPIAVPLDGGDAVLRATGFGSVRESNYHEGTRAMRRLQTGMNEAKSEIGNAYRKAVRTGDFEAVNADIAAWNARHPQDRIKPKDTLAWRKAEVKSKRDANAAGIRVDKSAEKYQDVARFALP